MTSPDQARPATDRRMLPVAAAAWAAAWLGTSGEFWWVVAGLIAGAVALGLAVAWRRRRVAGLAVVGLVLLCVVPVGLVHARVLSQSAIAGLASERAMVTLEVELGQDPRLAGHGPRVVWWARGTTVVVEGRGERITEAMPVLVVFSRVDEPLLVGSRLRVAGRLEPADPGSGTAAVVRVRGGVSVVAPPGPGMRLVERVRSGLRRSLEGRPAPQRALVPALVLGDVSGVQPGTDAQFRATGLTHLTAVSGANLSLLTAFVLTAARWLGVRGWGLRGLAVACVVVFVGLCRSEPSVLRAAAMGLVTLAALGSGATGPRALRHLGVATAGLVLLDPWLARSYGMALSVLACVGIVTWSSAWTRVLQRWLPRLVAESVAVPLAAQVLTQPVVAKLSGQVSLASLPANMAAGPFVGPATVGGFAAAGLGLLPGPWAWLPAFVAAWSAQVIIWVAEAGARLPGATMTWPTTWPALTVLTVGSLAGAALVPWLAARRWAVVAVALGLVVSLWRAPPQPGWPPRAWSEVFCDVGQGDAVVLAAGDHQAVLVDVGPDPTTVDRCLDSLDVRAVPVLLLTHFHADHVTGLERVLAERPVGLILVSPLHSPVPDADRVFALAAAHGVPVRVSQVGESLRAGQVGLRVVGPATTPLALTSAEGGESSAENDSSVVVVAETGGLRTLLPGDAEPTEQQGILARHPDLRADVLKLPHHGSARQERAFFNATGAQLAVASAGRDNEYGHPAPKTVALATELGMRVLRTDEQGSIALSREGGVVRVTTQR